MNETRHVLDDLAAYALGALDLPDKERVERHLATCEACQRELLEYHEAASLLARAVVQRDPDPALKDKLLTAVRQSGKPAGVGRPSFWDSFRSSQLQFLYAWSIASLLLIAVLGIGSIFLWREIAGLAEETQPRSFDTVALLGSDLVPEASAMIVVPSGQVVGTLVVNGLPPLDENQQYQLWLIRDEQRTSGAVFSMDEDGYDSVYLHLPETLQTYDSFGITIEPAGGSQQPTGARVLAGTLK